MAGVVLVAGTIAFMLLYRRFKNATETMRVMSLQAISSARRPSSPRGSLPSPPSFASSAPPSPRTAAAEEERDIFRDAPLSTLARAPSAAGRSAVVLPPLPNEVCPVPAGRMGWERGTLGRRGVLTLCAANCEQALHELHHSPETPSLMATSGSISQIVSTSRV